MIYLSVLIIIFAMIWQNYLNFKDRELRESREQDLMNRLMTKTLPEYAQVTKLLEKLPDDPMTAPEREAAIKLAMTVDADRLEIA